MRTEPLQRYGVTLVVDDRLLDDGPAVTKAIDALKQRFHRGLEEGHLKVIGEVRFDNHDYDPMAREIRMVISALTTRDPVFVQEILDDARRAVAEDQAWLASPA